jgi:hypothetical protein
MKNLQIPLNVDSQLARFMRDLLISVKTALDSKLDKEEAQGSVLLASPNGSVYSVAVSDAGILTATLVSS